MLGPWGGCEPDAAGRDGRRGGGTDSDPSRQQTEISHETFMCLLPYLRMAEYRMASMADLHMFCVWRCLAVDPGHHFKRFSGNSQERVRRARLTLKPVKRTSRHPLICKVINEHSIRCGARMLVGHEKSIYFHMAG